MIKKFIFIFLLTYISISGVISEAADNNQYYGDGVTVTFNDIALSLPSLYRNTPRITVTTAKGTRTYDFNVEMFIDRGHLVYGLPQSVTDLGYVNTFKQKDNGYFYSNGYGSTRGEYRYLGFSVNGSVYTNNYFPSDTVPGEHTYKVVKYSDLPEYLKEVYGIIDEGNSYFEGIRELIDAADSPAWTFKHTYESGISVTVYNKFKDSGLTGPGVISASIYDYARITGWGSGGGSIVLYYQSVNDPTVYRYATFTGTVNPKWAKGFKGLDCNIHYPTKDFKISKDDDYIKVSYYLEGVFTDDYESLSDILKRYTYTRDDLESYNLVSQSGLLTVKSAEYNSHNVCFYSDLIVMQYNREDLITGYNTVTVTGEARIVLDGCVFSAPATDEIYIYVEPQNTPEPEPTPTPEPTSTPAPNTEFEIRRRW